MTDGYVADSCVVHEITADEAGHWHKIVQSGPAVLENDVEVQANACVDRASVGGAWELAWPSAYGADACDGCLPGESCEVDVLLDSVACVAP